MRQADIRGIYGADLVELLAYSGMRLNEATELRWPDIDFDRGLLYHHRLGIRHQKP